MVSCWQIKYSDILTYFIKCLATMYILTMTSKRVKTVATPKKLMRTAGTFTNIIEKLSDSCHTRYLSPEFRLEICSCVFIWEPSISWKDTSTTIRFLTAWRLLWNMAQCTKWRTELSKIISTPDLTLPADINFITSKGFWLNYKSDLFKTYFTLYTQKLALQSSW